MKASDIPFGMIEMCLNKNPSRPCSYKMRIKVRNLKEAYHVLNNLPGGELGSEYEKYRIVGRGSWTPEKVDQYYEYQLAKHGKIIRSVIEDGYPSDMPVPVADYLFVYVR